MSGKAILVVAIFLLSGCGNYNRAQEQAAAEARAERQAQFDAYVATSHAAVREQMAQIDMNVTVCTARANATVPGAADHDPVTLHDRARLVEWAKVSDACFAERGGKVNPRTYPAMADMKQCDRESRSAMPTASTTQRNTYIDDCLETAGFTLPGH